jgi:regulator of sigma E protease
MIGEDARTPVLGDVTADSAAYTAGFRSGDKLISVNEIAVQTWEEFQKVLNQKNENDLKLDFVIQHEGTNEQSKISVVAKPEPNPNILSMYSHVANVPGLTTMAAGTTIGLDEKSRLYAMGLRTGDTINSINGHKVIYWRDLSPRLAKIDPKETLSLEIVGIREGDKSEKPMTITVSSDDSLKPYSLESLGLESSELYLSKVMESSPAEAAGLKQMDRLISINNIKLTKWEDVINNIKSFDGKNPVSISVLRDKKILDLKITPKMTTQMTSGGSEEKRYTIGIAPLVNLATQNYVLVKIANPFLALARGAERTWDVSIMTVMSFVRLFEAKISPKNIGGVLSIGQAASETFKMGLSQFLQMMAVISVNLFVLNLLPIPVLDGGHLVFYIVEIIKGAPLSLKKMEIAQQVGMALLMSLMVFALFNDFARLFGK